MGAGNDPTSQRLVALEVEMNRYKIEDQQRARSRRTRKKLFFVLMMWSALLLLCGGCAGWTSKTGSACVGLGV